MLKLLTTWIPMLLLWGASMYGTLQMNAIQSKWSYSACGPWGCGPTLESLAGYHAFWMTFLSLPAVLAFSKLSERGKRRLGLSLMGVGVVALVGIGVYVAAVWYPNVSEFKQAYWKQRYLYQVASLTDIPAIQCFIFGSAMWAMSRRSRETETSPAMSTDLTFNTEKAPSV